MAFSQLPSQAGVYWWLDENKKVLYVGKAKNLKNRVTSYRQKKELSPRILQMVTRARYLQWRILPSELEALLVEADLIRTYQPPYNVLLKDDKSPLYIVITNERFPRVLKMRRRDVEKKTALTTGSARVFGPFTSAYKVNEVLKLVRPIFPWCNAPRRKTMRRCLENHLGLCAGVCTGEVTVDAYRQIMQNLSLFLAGKKQAVEKQLQKELRAKVMTEEFEEAAKIRDKLNLIAEITDTSKRLKDEFFLPNLSAWKQENAQGQLRTILRDELSLPREYEFSRIEGYDVSNTSGQLAVVSMVVFTGGEADKAEYRSFNIRSLETPNDFMMLQEALCRRAKHLEWSLPDLLLIDGGKGQVRKVWEGLRGTALAERPIIGLAKDPDRIVIPRVGEKAGAPALVDWKIVRLSDDAPALQLLQQVRDEAHRFGKSKHVKRREQKLACASF